MRFSLSTLLLASSLVAAEPTKSGASKWSLKQFNSLITFGDSYTDENRLGYFGANGGKAPPAGTYFNESLHASSGGRIWARYVIQYTGSTLSSTFRPAITLYNYAVSGAVCSNNLSPRTFSSINAPFPDLDLYEIPAFIADKSAKNLDTGKPYFTPALSATNAVYAIWDGTNDVGNYAFLTDSQRAGATLVDYTNCIFSQMDRLYKQGGRYFVLMNLVPLYLAPLYAKLDAGGVTASRFWTDKAQFLSGNVTAIEEKMREQVALVNDGWKYRLPYEKVLAGRYPGAEFALFDTNKLFLDIYNNPGSYLNGTAPANVTGYASHCDLNGANCQTTSSPDSFLWWDELHPSEQVDRIVAKEFVSILSGKGKYATYV